MLDSILHPGWLLVLDWVIRLGLATHVIMRRRPVTTSLAWLVVLVFVPIFGIFVYLLVGEVRLGRRRTAAFDRLSRSLDRDAVAVWRHRENLDSLPDEPWTPIARYGTAVSGFPPVGGTSLTFINTCDDFLQSICRDIDAATDHCHLLTYIWMDHGQSLCVVDSLVRAAKRGVACRVLLDAVGSRAFLKSPHARRLTDAGVKLVAALPVNPIRMLLARIDLRNHRKIIVIDGRIAYVGSHNLTDDTFRSKKWRDTGPWIDASVRLVGPGAHALALVFLRDWLLDSDEAIPDFGRFLPLLAAEREGHSLVQVVPSGPGMAPEAIHQAMLTTIYAARDEIVMTTPYFVPDDATRMALQAAAMRGVAVTLVMPAVSDSLLVAAASRSHYLDLLESGVRIMHYDGGLLHAKTLTIDRRIALIGSANFDQRSFFLNFEITLFVYDDDAASMLRFMQTSYIDRSREVTLNQWRQRPLWDVFVDNSAQLLGPLL
jgi:cardiolipin synthase